MLPGTRLYFVFLIAQDNSYFHPNVSRVSRIILKIWSSVPHKSLKQVSHFIYVANIESCNAVSLCALVGIPYKNTVSSAQHDHLLFSEYHTKFALRSEVEFLPFDDGSSPVRNQFS